MTLILSGTDGLSDVDGSAATPAIRGTDANTGIFFPAADTIAFSEGGTEAMRIDSSGNVGIGTSSPNASYKMSITGNSASIYSGILFTDTNAGGGIFSIYGESGALKFRDSSAGVTRMTIDSSGNVGIGTTPSAWGSTPKAVQLPNGCAIANLGAGDVVVTQNAYFDNPNFKYASTTGVGSSAYRQIDGTHRWSYAASGTAGNNITFTEAMRIDSSGNFLVGTTSVPSLNGNTAGKFVVVNGTAQVGLQDNTDGGIFATYNLSKSIGLSAGSSYGSGAGQAFIKLTPTTGSSASIVATANTGGVQLTNGATSWASLSDIRLKDVTGGIENALSAVAQLEPIKFTWKSDEGKKPCVGLSAQSVQSVLPEAVDEFVVPESADETAYLTVRYTELVPLLTAAIKEQQALITQLQADVAALQAPQGTP